MKWLIATPGPGDRFLHVFRVDKCPCCPVPFEKIRLVGRFDSVQVQSGARLETGSAGFLRVFAADCVVPVPNCHSEITFTGAAA
jgi:hypothetical protein